MSSYGANLRAAMTGKRSFNERSGLVDAGAAQERITTIFGQRTFAETRGLNTGDLCLKCLGQREIAKQINSTKRPLVFIMGGAICAGLLHILACTQQWGYIIPLDVVAFVFGGLISYYAGQIRRWIDLI